MDLQKAEKALRGAEMELAKLQGEQKALESQRVEARRKLSELGIPEGGIEEALSRLTNEAAVLEAQLEEAVQEFGRVVAEAGNSTASSTDTDVLAFLTRG